jgi:DNA topoisomerase-1
VRLRRSVVRGPGLLRTRRGRGVAYHDENGRLITDAATLRRIDDLVIPPAWRRHLADDLGGRGLRRDRVLALGLYLLDLGYFRAGGEQYTEETDRLLGRNSSGWSEVHADDLNARFKEMVGEDYSVRDLRTWHGTVLAADAFADADPAVNKKVV